MRRTIELSSSVTELAVRPNTRVEAIIVESGEIVAEGFHSFDGGPQHPGNGIPLRNSLRLSTCMVNAARHAVHVRHAGLRPANGRHDSRAANSN